MSDLLHGDVFDRLPVLVVFGGLAVAIVGGLLGPNPVTAAVVALWFLVVLPLSYLFSDDLRRLFGRADDGAEGPDPTRDALRELRGMYERGDLTEAEFERRTARIVDNESLDDVRAWIDGDDDASASEADPDR